MGVRNMQGTPAHIEQLRRKEGDSRRYRGRCCYYVDATGQCKLKSEKCSGSSFCDKYSAMSDKEFHEKQAKLRKLGATSGRKKTGRNSSNSDISDDIRQRIEYKGEVFYFSNGRWLDSSFCFVPDELGRELATEFEKGRYFYRNTKPVRISYSIEKDAQTDSACSERKKAYVKTPSFARGKVDINELADSDKITLARYFGVSSSAYRTDKIELLGLPSRVANRFPHYNIYTVEDLLKLTWGQVLQIRNVGEKNRQTIDEKVREFLENKQLHRTETFKSPEIVKHIHEEVSEKNVTQNEVIKYEEVEEIETVPFDLFQIDETSESTFSVKDNDANTEIISEEAGVDESGEKSPMEVFFIILIMIVAPLIFLWAMIESGLWFNW